MRFSRRLVEIVLLVFPAVSLASGTPNDTVVIFHQGESAIVTALDAELTAAGMQPMDVIRGETDDDLPSIAEKLGASAGMHVVSQEQVDIFVFDAPGGWRTTPVRVSSSDEGTESLLALKATEQLQLQMSKLEASSRDRGDPGRDEDATMAPSGRTTESVGTAARLSLGLEPTVTYGFGELSAALHLHFYTHFRIRRGIGVRLFGLLPTHAMKLNAPEGSADVRVGVVGIVLCYEPLWKLAYEVRPSIGLSLSPGLMRMRGDGEGGFRDGDDWLVFPLAMLSAGAALPVSHVLSLRLDAGIGMALKRPVVRFADRTVTAWGRPAVWGMLGIEVWLF